MDTVLAVVASIVLVLMLVSAYRLVVGPTVFDRLIGVGIIGTKTILTICLIGFLFSRIEFFLDLAISYALLNFIGTIVITKYIEHGRHIERKEEYE